METIRVSLTSEQVNLLIGLLSERFLAVHAEGVFNQEQLAELDAISRVQAIFEIASEKDGE
jgi:hypothetical protein